MFSIREVEGEEARRCGQLELVPLEGDHCPLVEEVVAAVRLRVVIVSAADWAGPCPEVEAGQEVAWEMGLTVAGLVGPVGARQQAVLWQRCPVVWLESLV